MILPGLPKGWKASMTGTWRGARRSQRRAWRLPRLETFDIWRVHIWFEVHFFFHENFKWREAQHEQSSLATVSTTGVRTSVDLGMREDVVVIEMEKMESRQHGRSEAVGFRVSLASEATSLLSWRNEERWHLSWADKGGTGWSGGRWGERMEYQEPKIQLWKLVKCACWKWMNRHTTEGPGTWKRSQGWNFSLWKILPS